MSGELFSPNVSLLSSWRQSITVLLQTLRRVKFVVENTFSFGDFDPQPNWFGMAATNVLIYRARYLRIYKFLWISVDISATLAAPFTNGIGITIPWTLAGDIASNQAFGARVSNNSVNDSGVVIGNGTFSAVLFIRPVAANFTAGVTRITANGFFEVM